MNNRTADPKMHPSNCTCGDCIAFRDGIPGARRGRDSEKRCIRCENGEGRTGDGFHPIGVGKYVRCALLPPYESGVDSQPTAKSSNLRLGMDTPWPLPDVLAKLIEATEHLLGRHSCDAHGHEEFQTAVARGKEYLATLRAPVETKAPRGKQIECPWCHGSGGGRLPNGDVHDCDLCNGDGGVFVHPLKPFGDSVRNAVKTTTRRLCKVDALPCNLKERCEECPDLDENARRMP